MRNARAMLTACLALLIGAGVVSAQGMGRGGRGGRGPGRPADSRPGRRHQRPRRMGLPAGPARLKEVIKQLDLTPDQQAKIDGILAAGKGCGKGCGKECGKGCGKRCGKDAPPRG